MKKLAAVCIVRPVFAAMLIMCLVVVGTASYVRLGVDRFPAMDIDHWLRTHPFKDDEFIDRWRDDLAGLGLLAGAAG